MTAFGRKLPVKIHDFPRNEWPLLVKADIQDLALAISFANVRFTPVSSRSSDNILNDRL